MNDKYVVVMIGDVYAICEWDDNGLYSMLLDVPNMGTAMDVMKALNAQYEKERRLDLL